jgi:hypothetical protein
MLPIEGRDAAYLGNVRKDATADDHWSAAAASAAAATLFEHRRRAGKSTMQRHLRRYKRHQ